MPIFLVMPRPRGRDQGGCIVSHGALCDIMQGRVLGTHSRMKMKRDLRKVPKI